MHITTWLLYGWYVMGFGSSASNFEFSFGFIEGWYEDEEVDVVGDLVVDVGEGGSSSSNVAFSMDAGNGLFGEVDECDDGGSSASKVAFSSDGKNDDLSVGASSGEGVDGNEDVVHEVGHESSSSKLVFPLDGI